MVEDFLALVGVYRSWVGSESWYDDDSIFLQLGEGYRSGGYPFKLNQAWLKEVYFRELVR